MEAMALESLVASVWRLEGFLSITRYPVRVLATPDNLHGRGYSDIDVIGVRGDGTVRVAECKARGPAQRVNVDDSGRGWSSWWDGSLENLHRIWRDSPRWLPAARDVTSFEFHLVGNVWFASTEARALAERRLLRAARKMLPRPLRGATHVFVKPSVELVLNAIQIVREDVVEKRRGKRYGDPLLDALRELVRYAFPRPSAGGRVGSAISSELGERLDVALFGRVGGARNI